MGLLSLGKPLTWNETKKYADYVRTHGITQFLNTWDREKLRQGDGLLWGDEVEYMVVVLDSEERNAKVSLRQAQTLLKLQSLTDDEQMGSVPIFQPEVGSYMLESTPGTPYTSSLPDILSVEKNMRHRRCLMRKHLGQDEIPMSLTCFPRLGAPGVFTDPHYDPSGAVSTHSFFHPEELINEHPRFRALTTNTRLRRGSKVAINLPLFFDTNTPRPFIDPTIPFDRDLFPEDPEARNGAALQDHIYMDSEQFGTGCCCMQLTFQCSDVNEAKMLYDAFIPIAPIMLALTAASPFWRGYISDVDCRWDVIAAGSDDRTREERGLEPLKYNKHVIPKSRCGSVDMYISDDPNSRSEYNDILSPFDPKIYERLRSHGVDERISKHIAHLFIRDPLVLSQDSIEGDDTTSMDLFDNIQSSNWQTVRFKPPPIGSRTGWRVEFRSMEVQITDFENAALAVFIKLLSRAIRCLGLNFYLPISKVDENMSTAQKRGAARAEKFYFRKNIFPTESAPSSTSYLPTGSEVSSSNNSDIFGHKEKGSRDGYAPPSPEGARFQDLQDEYDLMTLEEIMVGKSDSFPGLLGVVDTFLKTQDMDSETETRIRRYLTFIRRRSTGSLKTPATWMRDFVRAHPGYKFDSIISKELNYDLLHALDQIERGTRKAPDLLPEDYCNEV